MQAYSEQRPKSFGKDTIIHLYFLQQENERDLLPQYALRGL